MFICTKILIGQFLIGIYLCLFIPTKYRMKSSSTERENMNGKGGKFPNIFV